MLDNPDAYSEQEIYDIVNSDENTREAYRLMVAAKQGYAHKQAKQSADARAAWQRFEEKHYPKPLNRQWMKMAASFIGILLISGIAFATIHIVRNIGNDLQYSAQDTQIPNSHKAALPADTLTTDTATVLPIIYDNIALEKMLQEIAAHYGVELRFLNDEARQLRFHFVWNPRQEIEKVVSDLNHFERLHVTVRDNQITVE